MCWLHDNTHWWYWKCVWHKNNNERIRRQRDVTVYLTFEFVFSVNFLVFHLLLLCCSTYLHRSHVLSFGTFDICFFFFYFLVLNFIRSQTHAHIFVNFNRIDSNARLPVVRTVFGFGERSALSLSHTHCIKMRALMSFSNVRFVVGVFSKLVVRGPFIRLYSRWNYPDAMSIEYQIKSNGISICTCVSYEKREFDFTSFTMTALTLYLSISLGVYNIDWNASLHRILALILANFIHFLRLYLFGFIFFRRCVRMKASELIEYFLSF